MIMWRIREWRRRREIEDLAALRNVRERFEQCAGDSWSEFDRLMAWASSLPRWRTRRLYRGWIRFFRDDCARREHERAKWECVDVVRRKIPIPPQKFPKETP